MATVTVPMVPWPHIGRQPLVSMNRMPTSQSGPGRRVEDTAGHHVVAARLEHQAGADPVVMLQEMLRAARSSVAPAKRRRAAGDDAHGIAAGVGVDAEKGMAVHPMCLFGRQVSGCF